MSRSEKSRKIIERIIVEGDLVLLTPTSLGNGDSDGLTDMSLLLDEIDGKALLTGASIAGALCNYLRECLLNFEVSEESQYKDTNGKRIKLKDASGNLIQDVNGKSVNKPLPIVTQLFGSLEDDGSQSYLIIDDALAKISEEDEREKRFKPKTELRDGVKIEGKTRIAEDGKKFDFELLEADTTFKLRFELLICEGQNRNDLVSAFATALQGFEKGEIHIGARKRRGYGECKVENWKFQKFDLTAKTGLLDWLKHDTNCLTVPRNISISTLITNPIDIREYFELNAQFALDGSILIRSGSQFSNKYQPDAVHLHSKRNGVDKPIISGTSLAGALRHRALKICKTIGDENKAEILVDGMFGVDMNKKPKDQGSSRLEVKEKALEIDNTLVQKRVKIDRFTGGAMDTALFDAVPVFSDGNEKAVTLSFKLRFKHDQKPECRDAEIGLLLLLLKDLWTSDLAIGGESSIGRGRLIGKKATLQKQKNGRDEFNINFDHTLNLTEENRTKLNGFVTELNSKLKPEATNGEQNSN